jgi:hypothetical protein
VTPLAPIIDPGETMKKTARNKRPLTLQPETIRILSHRSLAAAVAGINTPPTSVLSGCPDCGLK